MKFIVDAQLPTALATFLIDKGHDAVHTRELPDGNDTTDAQINALSIAENRIVVSKDGDFYDSFAARKEPHKLLHIKTGNISNLELIELIEKNLQAIIKELEEMDVVTIDQRYIIALH
jgi:predicted nuclease of predicted toxin-antitoxin system